ncbi:DNA translocase FtsK [bacterium]|nr:DNA translocase FtsK [bacterium]
MAERNKQESSKTTRKNPSQDLGPTNTDNWFVQMVDFLLKFRRFGKDILAILLILLALLTILALIGLTSGAWINPWADFLRYWFGWGSVLVVAAFAVTGMLLMQRREDPFTAQDWKKVIWLEISGFSILALLSIIGGNSLDRATIGLDGGIIGWGLAQFIRIIFRIFPEGFGNVLSVVFLLLSAVLGIMFGFQLFGRAIRKLEEVIEGAEKAPIDFSEDAPAVVIAGGEAPLKPGNGSRKSNPKKVTIPPQFRKEFKVEEQEEAKALEVMQRDDRLPPLSILQNNTGMKPSERHINQTAGLIEKTLAEFGIPAKVVGFQVGPTITQFAVEPGYVDRSAGTSQEDENKQKIRVAQIVGLRKDLALALSVERLRIQAPVPGRPYIGIEVPNEKSVIVGLRSILEAEAFYKVGAPLSIALGRDVSGAPVVADLARMPHMLIAGTTGSGKSVCIASLTACLVMNNSPEDLRLVMIDPKMVELVRFNGLPHLIGKVETDLERIAAVLRWVVQEMQERYKLLEDLRARDLDSYNRKAQRRKEFEPLPRIVVMIDELADLMMSSAETTEATVVRLAQMARAVGIHLVIATQRPSTDVVTGLIKANFPARISFAVASGVDSRVIIDTAGAETLLGRGDMLFVNPEEGTPIRAQGVYITDKEIEKIISYWQSAWDEGEDASPWELMMDEEESSLDRDELVNEALELLKQTGKASTSMLQRRLKIGYPRAARLMDELEDLGFVGPSRGGGRERDVYVDDDSEDYD